MMLRSVLAFLASLPLSIFSPYTISQTNYPPEYIEEYVTECTGDRGFLVEAVCRCVVAKAENEYDWEEFQSVDQEIEEGKREIPQELMQIIKNCEKDPFS